MIGVAQMEPEPPVDQDCDRGAMLIDGPAFPLLAFFMGTPLDLERRRCPQPGLGWIEKVPNEPSG